MEDCLLEERRAIAAIEQAAGPDEEDKQRIYRIRVNDRIIGLLIEFCHNLRQLPPEIQVFQRLTKLQLFECDGLTQLPREIGKLAKLQLLQLHMCPEIREIPQEISALQELRDIRLCYCNNLTDISPIEHLSKLEALTILGCKSIQNVQVIWSLLNLKELSLATSDDLPPDIENLSKLEMLDLNDSKKLQKLPPQIGKLPNLQRLFIKNFPSLVELPKEIEELEYLLHLNIRLCKNLVSLSQEIGQLSSLKSLCINDCEQLASLPGRLLSCPKLSRLEIRRCSRLIIPLQAMDQLNCSITEMSSDDDDMQKLFDVYTFWNRAGRALLKADNVPVGLWSIWQGLIA